MTGAISLEQGVAHNSLKMEGQEQPDWIRNIVLEESAKPCPWTEAYEGDPLIRKLKNDDLPCLWCDAQKTPCEVYKTLTEYNINKRIKEHGMEDGQ